MRHHPSRQLVATFVAALFATASFVGSSPAADDLSPGEIVLFGAKRQPDDRGVFRFNDVLAMKPDGSGLTELISRENGFFLVGRVGPDGRRLAFTVGRDENTLETWIVEADGARRRVDDSGIVQAWSPDGRALACMSGSHGNWESRLVDLESGEVRKLPIPPTDHVEDWSPAGDLLSVMAGNPDHVYEHPKSGTYPLRQIDVMRADGSDRRRITTGEGLDGIWSRFSPDGSRVAHFQRRHVGVNVFEGYAARGADGGDPVELMRRDRLSEELRATPAEPANGVWTPRCAPCWSPDGERIALCLHNAKYKKRGDPRRLAILIVNPDGEIERAVDLSASGIVEVGSIDWR